MDFRAVDLICAAGVNVVLCEQLLLDPAPGRIQVVGQFPPGRLDSKVLWLPGHTFRHAPILDFEKHRDNEGLVSVRRVLAGDGDRLAHAVRQAMSMWSESKVRCPFGHGITVTVIKLSMICA